LALNSRSSIDPRWLTHNRSVGYGLQLAQVEVYNPDSTGQTYDPVTNTWTGDKLISYTGPARVQQIGNAGDAGDTYNPTLFQNVRVEIPFGKNTLTGSNGVVPDIRPNDRLVVTSSPYNDVLTKFVFSVVGVINSSNAWERTLLCRVDTELDPTNN
jgi:hypothetical protein